MVWNLSSRIEEAPKASCHCSRGLVTVLFLQLWTGIPHFRCHNCLLKVRFSSDAVRLRQGTLGSSTRHPISILGYPTIDNSRNLTYSRNHQSESQDAPAGACRHKETGNSDIRRTDRPLSINPLHGCLALCRGQIQRCQIKTLPGCDARMASHPTFNKTHTPRTKSTVTVKNQKRKCLIHILSVAPIKSYGRFFNPRFRRRCRSAVGQCSMSDQTHFHWVAIRFYRAIRTAVLRRNHPDAT